MFVQFSTDGSTMFCQCGCSVKVLDVATGKQISNVLAVSNKTIFVESIMLYTLVLNFNLICEICAIFNCQSF